MPDPGLNLEEKRQFYLAKAREAEEAAAGSDDPDTKTIWLKIAENYRQLAEVAVKPA